jgi:hypothetical protein
MMARSLASVKVENGAQPSGGQADFFRQHYGVYRKLE